VPAWREMLILVAAPKQHRTAARALESCRGCCHSTEDSEASPNRSGRSSKQTTMSTVLLKLDESYWAPPPFKGFHTECSEIFWTCQRCRRGTTNTTDSHAHRSSDSLPLSEKASRRRDSFSERSWLPRDSLGSVQCPRRPLALHRFIIRSYWAIHKVGDHEVNVEAHPQWRSSRERPDTSCWVVMSRRGAFHHAVLRQLEGHLCNARIVCRADGKRGLIGGALVRAPQ